MTTDRAALAHLRHELRTPLNHIIGYSEMLLEEVESTPGAPQVELAASLHRLHADARELLSRINAFLTPDRIEVGAVDPARMPVELVAPLDRIVAAGATLTSQAAAAGADGLRPDLGRIAAAAAHLLHLVRHGISSPPAGVGPGRADVPTHAQPEQAPSDSAAAEAEAGKPDATAAPMPSVTEPRTPISTVTGSKTERGAILVVDDNDENRDMLARRLRREGHEVRLAASGYEALATLPSHPVDLVLLDVMMPGMTGDEVLRRLKADPASRDIPVLMISALDEVESVVRCIELGAEDYLPKPFDPVLLRARIGACLEKKRLRDQEVRHLAELAEWNRTLEQRVQEKVAEVEQLGRLKRFFSPQLAELIVTGGADDPLRTHRREITVVFLDLRGFTAFAETAEPEEMMGVLREYHAAMGELILAHEGTLERFTGDGMMIFFNDPVVVPNAAERAVRMAVAMRERVHGLSATWRKRGYDLDVGIGIAQGYATIGAIGFEGRWDYGAIGTVTNLAARLCGEARGGQILISSRVAGSVEDLVELEEVGALSLKGLLKPVPTANVLRLK